MQIFKKKCERCGFCCREEVCQIGSTFCKTETAPCPALEIDGYGSAVCGLISSTSKYVFPGIGLTKKQYDKIRDWFLEVLAFGVGCDAKGEEMIYQFKA